MENMKYFTFKRESNDFTDILDDAIIKKLFMTKIQWSNHLLVGISEAGNDGSFSYITLKYGDDMINDIVPDRSPVMFKDYQPKGHEKYTGSIPK
jgi:hypothetical protein